MKTPILKIEVFWIILSFSGIIAHGAQAKGAQDLSSLIERASPYFYHLDTAKMKRDAVARKRDSVLIDSLRIKFDSIANSNPLETQDSVLAAIWESNMKSLIGYFGTDFKPREASAQEDPLLGAHLSAFLKKKPKNGSSEGSPKSKNHMNRELVRFLTISANNRDYFDKNIETIRLIIMNRAVMMDVLFGLLDNRFNLSEAGARYINRIEEMRRQGLLDDSTAALAYQSLIPSGKKLSKADSNLVISVANGLYHNPNPDIRAILHRVIKEGESRRIRRVIETEWAIRWYESMRQGRRDASIAIDSLGVAFVDLKPSEDTSRMVSMNFRNRVNGEIAGRLRETFDLVVPLRESERLERMRRRIRTLERTRDNAELGNPIFRPLLDWIKRELRRNEVGGFRFVYFLLGEFGFKGKGAARESNSIELTLRLVDYDSGTVLAMNTYDLDTSIQDSARFSKNLHVIVNSLLEEFDYQVQYRSFAAGKLGRGGNVASIARLSPLSILPGKDYAWVRTDSISAIRFMPVFISKKPEKDGGFYEFRRHLEEHLHLVYGSIFQMPESSEKLTSKNTLYIDGSWETLDSKMDSALILKFNVGEREIFSVPVPTALWDDWTYAGESIFHRITLLLETHFIMPIRMKPATNDSFFVWTEESRQPGDSFSEISSQKASIDTIILTQYVPMEEVPVFSGLFPAGISQMAHARSLAHGSKIRMNKPWVFTSGLLLFALQGAALGYAAYCDYAAIETESNHYLGRRNWSLMGAGGIGVIGTVHLGLLNWKAKPNGKGTTKKY